MATVALTGVAIIALSAVVDALWLGLIGAMVLGVAPVGLLVPAIKISSERAPREGRGYKDMNFVGGAMTVLGVRPSEQDKAAAEVSRRKGGGGE
jgi:MFS family permease